MNKKAQIGLTLTWLVAFVVIFFIMIVFTTTSIFLSKSREIPVVGKGTDSVNLKENVIANYKIQRDLHSFYVSVFELNGRKTSVSDFLLKSSITDSELNLFEEHSVKYFDSVYSDCHSICAKNLGSTQFIQVIKNGCFENRNCAYLAENRDDLARSYIVYPFNGETIEIALYAEVQNE